MKSRVCLWALSSFLIVMLGSTGCVSTGSPGSDPVYHATDTPATMIPQVKDKYAGKTVAVVPYVNKTLSEYRYLGDASVGILPEYLLEAGFQPIESAVSDDMKAVLEELKYGQSDNVNPATASQIGEQMGTKYVFVGEVNGYRIARPKGTRKINIGGYGINTGGAGITYDLQVSGRLIDVETRAIIASKSIAHNQTFKLSGGGVNTPFGNYGQSQEIRVEQENSGKVLKAAMNRLVAAMITQLNRRP